MEKLRKLMSFIILTLLSLFMVLSFFVNRLTFSATLSIWRVPSNIIFATNKQIFFLFFFNIKTNNQSFFDFHVKENLPKQAIHKIKLNKLDLREIRPVLDGKNENSNRQ
jgi:hypothetical protein